MRSEIASNVSTTIYAVGLRSNIANFAPLSRCYRYPSVSSFKKGQRGRLVKEYTTEAMSDGESADGRRMSKKRKASRACDRCNSQHQPCDNASPKCSVCERAGTDCTYNRPVRKRGPRSGYTGQNGERLWSIVLQTRPDLEDLVLQILRSGTYGDTGISNYDYFKNNDNQTELVSHFNESRLGRYLQHGESADLMLPPADDQSPALAHQVHRDLTPKSQSSNPAISVDVSGPVANAPNSLLSAISPTNSGIVNPHGAPQNPADIYLQSDDIRKRMFHADQAPSHGGIADSPQTGFGSVNFKPSPVSQPIAQNAPFEHDFTNGYNDILRQRAQENIALIGRPDSKASTSSSPQLHKPEGTASRSLERGDYNFDATDTFHWCVLLISYLYHRDI